MRHSVVLTLTLCMLSFSASVTLGGKIGPIPLEQQVAKADFVGIVECEMAGAIVANYKVIESCRGAKAGEHIHIRTFARIVGPQFRISLVGQRFFVLAVRTGPDENYGNPVAGVPLSWRQLHADYQVAYGQGPSLDSPDTQKRYQEAKRLVSAAPAKAEGKLAKNPPDIAWKAPLLPPPAKAQLDDWRKTLAEKSTPGPKRREEQTKAKEGLFAYEPSPLFKDLVDLALPAEQLGRVDQLYDKVSYAAWRCGQDREKHLKMLLTAKEPMVRVAGAIYLCFEDEKLGMNELAALAKLDDEAGAWASLVLARRGQKDAVPGVLQVFNAGHPRGNRFYTNLRFNAQVLLSNSAHQSGVPQPPRADPMRPWGDEVDFAAIQAWWRQHAAKINVHDPWLERLTKQKID
jgi:hypothetical protein